MRRNGLYTVCVLGFFSTKEQQPFCHVPSKFINCDSCPHPNAATEFGIKISVNLAGRGTQKAKAKVREREGLKGEREEERES